MRQSLYACALVFLAWAPAARADFNVYLQSLGYGEGVNITYGQWNNVGVFAGQFKMIRQDTNASFISYCVDLNHEQFVATSQNKYSYTVSQQSVTGSDPLTPNGASIGYLFAKYGTGQNMTPGADKGQWFGALQVAMWELIAGDTVAADGSQTGPLTVTTADTGLLTQAAKFVTESQNKCYNGYWLDASASNTVVNGKVVDRAYGQSLIGPVATPAPPALFLALIGSAGVFVYRRRLR